MEWPPLPPPGFRPVPTQLGTFWGRDCIFLDGRRFSATDRMLTLFGEINGPLCAPRFKAKWIGYEIRFAGIVAHRVYDLDDPQAPQREFSSFCEDIRANLPQRLHRYVFSTYDDIFEVDCSGFVLAVGAMRDENGDLIDDPSALK